MLRPIWGVLEIIPSQPECGKESNIRQHSTKAGWKKSSAKGAGALGMVKGSTSKDEVIAIMERVFIVQCAQWRKLLSLF